MRIYIKALSNMDTHQKNHCITVDTHQPWTSTIVNLSETHHSVANRIGMHVNKCPMMDLHVQVGVGGSLWLDSYISHVHMCTQIVHVHP